MLKHADLMASTAFIQPTTRAMWAIRDGAPPVQVTKPEAVNPEWSNLINSSLLLYRTSADVEGALLALIDWAEDTGNDVIVSHLTSLAASINLARRCATEGQENVAATIKKA